MIKIPKVSNVRLGFATNSSSSHSIIMGKPSNLSSLNGDYVSMGQYGWEWFVLTEAKDKAAYMLVDGWTAEDIAELTDKLSYNEVLDIQKNLPEFNYIDHESVGNSRCLPEGFDISQIFNDDIAIVGGNDNSERPDWLSPFVNLSDLSGHRCMSHDNGNKVYFNSSNGEKFRITVKELGYSPIPELVDVKITDYCAMGCSYCYQGSTKEGVHASLENIKSIIDKFSEKGVFELAIGGGEPTSHPDFKEILKYAASKFVVPNFTSRSLKQLVTPSKNNALSKAVDQHSGGWAYSIDNLSALKRIDKLKEEINALRKEQGYGYGSTYGVADNVLRKMSIQVVLGTLSKNQMTKLFDWACEKDFSITVLGYKTTGRGNEVTPKDDSWFPELVKKYQILKRDDYRWNFEGDNLLRLGVDTCVIEKFEKELGEYINPVLFTNTEGTHSMYVDAVTMKGDVSSYTNKADEFDFNDDWQSYYIANAKRESSKIKVA